jgi:DNA-binding GntR family transcriptional regulator
MSRSTSSSPRSCVVRSSPEIPPHRPVLSKKTLVQTYGVAPGTVDRALAILKAEGMLKTVMGRGLYVIPKAERRPQG